MDIPFIPEAVSAASVLAVTFAFLRFIASQNSMARSRDKEFLQQLDKMSDRHDEREKETNGVLRDLTTTIIKMKSSRKAI